MNDGTKKKKWKSIVGWFLQIYAAINLGLIMYAILFIPIPAESDPETYIIEYEEMIAGMSPYSALFWVGVFCLGRWLIKKDKQQIGPAGRTCSKKVC